MTSLRETVAEQSIMESKTAVNAFKSNHEKNKMISAYVNTERYEKFSAINKKRGISNNKILNLMIADYVLEHDKLLNK